MPSACAGVPPHSTPLPSGTGTLTLPLPLSRPWCHHRALGCASTESILIRCKANQHMENRFPDMPTRSWDLTEPSPTVKYGTLLTPMMKPLKQSRLPILEPSEVKVASYAPCCTMPYCMPCPSQRMSGPMYGPFAATVISPQIRPELQSAYHINSAQVQRHFPQRCRGGMENICVGVCEYAFRQSSSYQACSQ